MKQIEILKKTRLYLLDLMNGLSIDEMNQVPEGFNNNIVWYFGHMLAGQQSSCYLRAGLPMFLDEKYFMTYKGDNKLTHTISEEEWLDMKQWFIVAIEQLEKDYDNKVFENYTPWINRYGVEHKNIDDTINFLLFHEGLHVGYIMALKRAVKNELAEM